jgi:hypothetical protein
MVLKELVLNSLENLNSFYVNDKPLTPKGYELLADYVIKNYYLDIKDNKAVAVVTMENYKG